MNRQQFLKLFTSSSKKTTGEWWEEYGVRAEYLTTDGTAYIDTGYKLEYANGITDLTFSISKNIDTATSIYGFINRDFAIEERIAVGSTSLGLFVGSGNTNYIETTIQDEVYNIIWNRETERAILNGEEKVVPNARVSGQTFSAYLGSRNNNGKPDADGIYNIIGNLHYLKETKDNIIQFEYIPIFITQEFTDRNGVTHNIGDFIMVNKLSNKDVPIHYGTFTGVVNNELMWFETTPNNTSIKTNFIPTTETAPFTKIELMCSFTSGSTGYLVNGIGGGPTMYIGMNPSTRLAYGNLATDASIAYNLSYDTYYKLTLDYKNKTISVDDKVIASNISLYQFNRNDVNFGLGCYVNPNTKTIFNNWGQKTKYCKIYVDDVLTHHWVGKLNNKEVDVYDKIEKVYLGDLGLIEGSENIIAGELS